MPELPPATNIALSKFFSVANERDTFMQGLADWLWTYAPATYENLPAHFLAQAEGFIAHKKGPQGPAVAAFVSGLTDYLIARGPAPAQNPQAFYITHAQAYLAGLPGA